MRYVEFRNAIESELRRVPAGLTWKDLKKRLRLPYEMPCAQWVKQMEQEIGLSRERVSERAFTWLVSPRKLEKGKRTTTRGGRSESKKKTDFDLVCEIARALPGVKESTIHGVPSLKVRGKLLTCPALHKSAEENSLAVRIDFDQRTDLIAAKPGIYYLTNHYENYPMVLVRLSLIDKKALRELLEKAWHFCTPKRSKT
jgi:hypothetical protein